MKCHMKPANLILCLCIALACVQFDTQKHDPVKEGKRMHNSPDPRKFRFPLPGNRFNVIDLLKSFVGMREFGELRFDVKDIPNGYLRFSTPASDIFDETFVLFRRDDGKAVVAYSYMACGPVCGQELGFFKIDESAFVEITDEVISRSVWEKIEKHAARAGHGMEYAGALFVLPRHGKTIEVWLADDGDKTSKKLAEMDWDGKKFVVR